jgi:hypothetical protein
MEAKPPFAGALESQLQKASDISTGDLAHARWR